MKMLNKEECEKALDNLSRYAEIGRAKHGASGCVVDNFVGNNIAIIYRLLKEHFEPQPYNFENLKKEMWVWDDVFKEIGYIYSIANKKEIYIEYLESHCANNHYQIQPFEENRFYPVNTKSYVSRKGI